MKETFLWHVFAKVVVLDRHLWLIEYVKNNGSPNWQSWPNTRVVWKRKRIHHVPNMFQQVELCHSATQDKLTVETLAKQTSVFVCQETIGTFVAGQSAVLQRWTQQRAYRFIRRLWKKEGTLRFKRQHVLVPQVFYLILLSEPSVIATYSHYSYFGVNSNYR